MCAGGFHGYSPSTDSHHCRNAHRRFLAAARAAQPTTLRMAFHIRRHRRGVSSLLPRKERRSQRCMRGMQKRASLRARGRAPGAVPKSRERSFHDLPCPHPRDWRVRHLHRLRYALPPGLRPLPSARRLVETARQPSPATSSTEAVAQVTVFCLCLI